MAEEFYSPNEVMVETAYQDEYARLQLESISYILAEQEIEHDLIFDEDAGYLLLVQAHGVERNWATFSIDMADETEITLNAFYSSQALEDALVDNMDLDQVPDFEDITENFVKRFVWECFIKEHEAVAELTGISEENADLFADYLPDYFFEEDGFFAWGITLKDPEGDFPCGAAVFSFRDGGALIEDVFIQEECRGMGLGTYLADQILRTYSEEEN